MKGIMNAVQPKGGVVPNPVEKSSLIYVVCAWEEVAIRQQSATAQSNRFFILKCAINGQYYRKLNAGMMD